MAHQKTEKTAKFEKKLNRINHHLILNTFLSESFLRRLESTKKIINSRYGVSFKLGKQIPKIPTPPWLYDPIKSLISTPP